jgi:cytochrome b
VGFFTLAWLSAEEIQFLHEWSGYAVAGLVGFRLIWGVIGTRYARFTNFVYRPSTVMAYLRSMLTRKPRHYTGHNPAGGAMVVVMLLMLALLTFTGMALVAIEGGGPLAGTVFATFSEGWVKDIHELVANLMLLLVAAHVAGVIVSSVLHRENLVRSMLTGMKRRHAETEDQA